MIDLRHKLTVDDLIVKYMIVKVKLGYEPSYTIDEFISFLKYFKQYKEVYDVIDDGDMLFDRFFERKKDDWTVSLGNNKGFIPHMERLDNGLIIPTNKLSNYDDSVINIYFMSRDEKIEIVNIIANFLKDYPKRSVDITTSVSDQSLELGELIAALFVNSIWDEYVKGKIKLGQWPRQCLDINQYLLDMDLAKIINLDSIREDLLSFYKDASKRTAVLIDRDPKLMIRNLDNPYLPYANYRCIMGEYTDLLYCMCIDCSFEVGIEDRVFLVNPDINDRYSVNIKTKLDDSYTRKLVRSINSKIYGE